MNSVKQFISSSAIYFIGNVLSKLALFFMIPFYTKYISPADYGYYDVSLAFLNIFTSALFLEIWSTVLRFMFDDSGRNKHRALYNGCLIMIISCVGYGIISCFIPLFFSIPSFSFIALYGLLFCWQNFYAYAARGFGESFLFAISGIVNTLVMIAFNLTLILHYQYGYNSLYIAAIAGMSVQIIMLECRLKIMSHFQKAYLQPALLREMIRFALPLSLNSICYWLLTDYNRVVILKYLGLYSNGLFAIAGKFAMVLVLVSSCFTLAWQETAFAKGGGQESDIGQFYSNAGNVCARFLICGSMVFLPFISITFPLMVDQTYQEARAIIPLYLLATMASIFSVFLGNIFGALKKTKIIFISTMSACLTNVLVVHSTVEAWGIQAVSVALLAGYLVNIIIRMHQLRTEIGFCLNRLAMLVLFPILGLEIYIYFALSYRANLIVLPIAIMAVVVFLKNDLRLIITKIRRDR